MDLEDWELLSVNSFKDLDLDHEEEEDHHGVMVMEDPLHKTESSPSSIVVPKTLLQVPITWEPLLDQETMKTPDPDSKQTLLSSSPRVSFLKETEFVDMKIDPPMKIMSPVHQEGGDDLCEKKEVVLEEEEGDKRMKLWKVGLNGIGAICSFGVAAAAATVCVFFLGHNNIKICKNKNKNQMLRFQIYSDDHKRMKEEVNHTKKMNEAIFGMKGVPVVRAQIPFGGYYDA